MSDTTKTIVESMRDGASVLRKHKYYGSANNLAKAADTIEKLQAEIAKLQADLASVVQLRHKLITDTGKGCSVCGKTPVVHVPDEGSNTYWLCGGCVALELEEKRAALINPVVSPKTAPEHTQAADSEGREND